MTNLLHQKIKETTDALLLEKTMLDNEKELQETIKKHKEVDADEEQKRILGNKSQLFNLKYYFSPIIIMYYILRSFFILFFTSSLEEQEEKLLMKVEELKEESILKDNKIKELEKIIEIYEKKDSEEMARKEKDQERQIKEAEINEQIRRQEEEKMRIVKEREEIEKAKLVERKKLEEKYREKLDIARSKKKKLSDNNYLNPSNVSVVISVVFTFSLEIKVKQFLRQ